MGSRMVHEAMHRHSFKAALSKVAVASRRLRRGREKRPRPEFILDRPPAAAPPPRPSQPDPVKIAVLAMEHVGRASMRACFTGTEINVAVPDDATAAILRAALSETARSRATDKLIRIVVG
jgi:hypothetical protein